MKRLFPALPRVSTVRRRCSSAYAESLGLEEKTALKIAAGFGGGMGRMAETCGAVTGALMALGLKYGGATPDPQAKETAYQRVREFAARFKASHGSLACRDLLECDIGTAEGRAIAAGQSLFTTRCPEFVRLRGRNSGRVCCKKFCSTAAFGCAERSTQPRAAAPHFRTAPYPTRCHAVGLRLVTSVAVIAGSCNSAINFSSLCKSSRQTITIFPFGMLSTRNCL